MFCSIYLCENFTPIYFEVRKNCIFYLPSIAFNQKTPKLNKDICIEGMNCTLYRVSIKLERA